jgi:hypothetical protein
MPAPAALSINSPTQAGSLPYGGKDPEDNYRAGIGLVLIIAVSQRAPARLLFVQYADSPPLSSALI